MKTWRDNPNISLYLDGQAGDDVRRQVEQAAAADPALQRFLQDWPAVKQAFAELPQHRLGESFADAVLVAIAAQQQQSSGIAAPSISATATAASLPLDKSQLAEEALHPTNGLPQLTKPAVSRASVARRWNASAWLGLAAAACLMAMILLPPGTLTSPNGTAADVALRTPELRKSLTDDPKPNEAKEESEARQDVFKSSGGILGVDEADAEDSIKAGMGGIVGPSERQPEAADRGLGTRLDQNTRFDAKAEKAATAESAEPPRESRGAGVVPARSDADKFDRNKDVDQNGDVEQLQDAIQDRAEAMLGSVLRIRQQLSELQVTEKREESNSPRFAYLPEDGPAQGPEVMVCDLVVPEGISNDAVIAAFETALNEDPQEALAQVEAFFSQNGVKRRTVTANSGESQDADALGDQEAGAAITLGGGLPPAAGIKLLQDAQKRGEALGNLETGQTQEEVYYIESTREQIDAAIESLAYASGDNLSVRQLSPSDNAVDPLALYRDALRLRLSDFGQAQPGNRPDAATANFGRGPGGDERNPPGDAGFGGGGGSFQGNSAQDNELARKKQAAEARKRAEDANKVDTTDGANKEEPGQGKNANADQLPASRGIAVRLPAHLYGRNYFKEITEAAKQDANAQRADQKDSEKNNDDAHVDETLTRDQGAAADQQAGADLRGGLGGQGRAAGRGADARARGQASQDQQVQGQSGNRGRADGEDVRDKDDANVAGSTLTNGKAANGPPVGGVVPESRGIEPVQVEPLRRALVILRIRREATTAEALPAQTDASQVAPPADKDR